MNEQMRNEIIRRWYGGESMRSIGRNLKICRRTVKRALDQHQADRAAGKVDPDLPQPIARGRSLVDDYEQNIADLLTRYPDITVVRLLQELQAQGYQGSYTILRKRVQQLRPRPVRRPVVRFETGPGAQAQMDYAVYNLQFSEEGPRRVNLFSYILSYSRRQYLRFTESQDMETTLREHIRAFEHLQGVAATCLYDNMKVVVARYEDEEPVYNTRFLAFATHYGYQPWACRRRRPQTKGKVERPFYFVETNLFNGRTFRSLQHLNETTAWWLANVADVRTHRETQRRPVDMHAEELSFLIPLPQQPYDTAKVVYRTVDSEGLVAYRQNFYSVPWHYIGQMLAVRITQDELIVYNPQLQEIARHRLLSSAVSRQRSELKEHLPPADLREKYEMLRERFQKLGEVALRFFDGLLAGQRCGKDQAHKVLALLGTYRRVDVLAALERAVRYGAFSLQAVLRILAVQAEPKTTLESLAEESAEHLRPLLDDQPVPPRPTTDYQNLLEQEPSDEVHRERTGANEETGADEETDADDDRPPASP